MARSVEGRSFENCSCDMEVSGQGGRNALRAVPFGVEDGPPDRLDFAVPFARSG